MGGSWLQTLASILFLMAAFGGIVGLLFLPQVLRMLPLRNRWRDAAGSLGLSYEAPTLSGLLFERQTGIIQGEVDGLSVQLGGPFHELTLTVTAPELPDSIAFRTEKARGLLQRSISRPSHMRTGDESFDRVFLCRGDSSKSLAVLDRSTRHALLGLLPGEPNIRIVVRMEEGVLTVKPTASPAFFSNQQEDETSHRAATWVLFKFPQPIIAQAIKVMQALRENARESEQILLQSYLNDPEESVQLRYASALLEGFPDSEEATQLKALLLEHSQIHHRWLGLLHNGEEGQAEICQLACDAEQPDEIRLLALDFLEEEAPAQLYWDALEGAEATSRGALRRELKKRLKKAQKQKRETQGGQLSMALLEGGDAEGGLSVPSGEEGAVSLISHEIEDD
jgi:hypothetical protein